MFFHVNESCMASMLHLPVRVNMREVGKPRSLSRLAVASLGSVVALATLLMLGASLEHGLAWVFMMQCIVIPLWLRPDLSADAFHPMAFFTYGGVVSFGFPALWYLLTASESPFKDQFVYACMLIGSAFGFCWLGYSLDMGEKFARAIPVLSYRPSNRPLNHPLHGKFGILISLYSVGWLGRLASARLGFSHLPFDVGVAWHIGGLLSDLGTTATLCYAVICFALLRRKKRRMRAWALVATLTLLEIWGGVINGGRTAIVLPILQLLVVYSLAVRPIRWRTLVFGYTVALFLLAPLLTVYRDVYYSILRAGSSPGPEAATRAIAAAHERVSSGSWDRNAVLRSNISADNMTVFDGTVRVLYMVPASYEFAFGKTVWPSILTMIVPRVLWPEKPLFLPSRVFAVMFWGADYGEELGTSIGIGMPAEAFYNFGWLGIMLFPAFGIMLRFFSVRLKIYEPDETMAVLRSFFVLFNIANMAPALLLYIVGGVRQAILYTIVGVVLTARVPQLRISRSRVPRVAG